MSDSRIRRFDEAGQDHSLGGATFLVTRKGVASYRDA